MPVIVDVARANIAVAIAVEAALWWWLVTAASSAASSGCCPSPLPTSQQSSTFIAAILSTPTQTTAIISAIISNHPSPSHSFLANGLLSPAHSHLHVTFILLAKITPIKPLIYPTQTTPIYPALISSILSRPSAPL